MASGAGVSALSTPRPDIAGIRSKRRPVAPRVPLSRSLRPRVTLEIRRKPPGVVGAITPWNFPLAVPARKIAPVLAFGNRTASSPQSRRA